MPRLVILLVAGFLLYLAYKYFSRLPRAQQKKLSWKVLVASLLIIVLFLVTTGKLSWLGAALTSLLAGLPRLMRTAAKFWPFLRQWQNFRGGRQTANASMKTAYLKIVMDTQSGRLNGMVLKGRFQGRRLAEMSLAECLQLLQECQTDTQSAALLMSYLDASHANWRQGYQGQQRSASSSSPMSPQEASEVLGVALGADKKTVIQAHKSLMQKLHPDRGGSDYLAAKINQARDVLLS